MTLEHTDVDILARLETLLVARRQENPETSYVATMHAKGLDAVLLKLSEEAAELMLASRNLQSDPSRRAEVIHEAADLLFHWLLLLAHQDVSLAEVLAELKRRQGRSGLEEKAARG